MAFLVVYHKTNGGVIIIILNQDMTPYSVNLRKTEVPIRLYETPYMADWGGVPSCSTPPPVSGDGLTNERQLSGSLADLFVVSSRCISLLA